MGTDILPFSKQAHVVDAMPPLPPLSMSLGSQFNGWSTDHKYVRNISQELFFSLSVGSKDRLTDSSRDIWWEWKGDGCLMLVTRDKCHSCFFKGAMITGWILERVLLAVMPNLCRRRQENTSENERETERETERHIGRQKAHFASDWARV